MFDGIETCEKGLGLPAVVRSLDFRRIEALPRRRWWDADAEQLEQVCQAATDYLKRSGGTMKLRPIQAAALQELAQWKGLFGPVPVGEGKTLITLLAPLAVDAERPLLLLPAQLRDQTRLKVLPEMLPHWKLPARLDIISYEELSLEKNAKMLERLSPDLIICDEVHYLKNPRSGRTRRVSRYMKAHPDTIFVGLSGTITTHSLMDYWHIIQWALKPHRAPMPMQYLEAKEWALALDERVVDLDRRGPGALMRFAEPGETARQGYRRRLVETPGVVTTKHERLGTSLVLRRRGVSLPPAVKEVIDRLHSTWETPDGRIVKEAVDLWRLTREMVCGFYYRWDPEPPLDWMHARQAWAAYVREILRTNQRGLDTELQVWGECARMQRPPPAWSDWVAAKDTFKPNSVPTWLSDYLVDDVGEWLDTNDGIAWVEHRAFGARLAGKSFQYYGAGDSRILEGAGPVAASVAAHSTGKNLQQWSRNLVVCPPSGGKRWEQLLGRTHRPGQLEDEVLCDVYLHHQALEDAFKAALADAVYIEETLGQPQRLLYSAKTFTLEEARW